MKGQTLPNWCPCSHWGPQGHHEHSGYYVCKLGGGTHFRWWTVTGRERGAGAPCFGLTAPQSARLGKPGSCWHSPRGPTQRACPRPPQPAPGLLPKEEPMGPLARHTRPGTEATWSHLDDCSPKWGTGPAAGGLHDSLLTPMHQFGLQKNVPASTLRTQ